MFDSVPLWDEGKSTKTPWGAEITHMCCLQPGASQLPQVICATIQSGEDSWKHHGIIKWLQWTIHFIYCKSTNVVWWVKLWLFCRNSNNMPWVERHAEISVNQFVRSRVDWQLRPPDTVCVQNWTIIWRISNFKNDLYSWNMYTWKVKVLPSNNTWKKSCRDFNSY